MRRAFRFIVTRGSLAVWEDQKWSQQKPILIDFDRLFGGFYVFLRRLVGAEDIYDLLRRLSV